MAFAGGRRARLDPQVAREAEPEGWPPTPRGARRCAISEEINGLARMIDEMIDVDATPPASKAAKISSRWRILLDLLRLGDVAGSGCGADNAALEPVVVR